MNFHTFPLESSTEYIIAWDIASKMWVQSFLHSAAAKVSHVQPVIRAADPQGPHPYSYGISAQLSWV